jgi:hypothetical protein
LQITEIGPVTNSVKRKNFLASISVSGYKALRICLRVPCTLSPDFVVLPACFDCVIHFNRSTQEGSMVKTANLALVLPFSGDNPLFLSIFQSLQPQRKRGIVSQFSPNTPDKALRIFASRER